MPEFISSEDQVRAFNTLLNVIRPENLLISEKILELIPPRTPGYRETRELFPGYTGIVFDHIAAAETVAEITVAELLDPERAARIVNFNSRNKDLPSLDYFIGALVKNSWMSRTPGGSLGEIKRTVDIVVLNRLIQLAADQGNSPSVRAVARNYLLSIVYYLEPLINIAEKEAVAHLVYGRDLINFYLENPDRVVISPAVKVPDGAPIGSY